MRNIFLLFILLILSSCSSVPSTSSTNTEIENIQWILEDRNLAAPNEITLLIDKGKVSGNASCNNYFGALSYDASTRDFSVSNIGATIKACHKMSAENYFLNMLEKVNKYQSNQQYLELYKDNILLLKFKKQ